MMNKMKLLNNNSGFTLVEMIISIVILGIMATAIMPLISDGNISVLRSGDKSRAMYTAQSSAENLMQSNPYTGSGTADSTPIDPLTIRFDATTSIDVKGTLVEIKEKINTTGQRTTLKIFLPN